jgi:type I restriction enzyme S subunit
VGDVLHLERRKVDVRMTEIYREVGIRSFGKGIFHKSPISGAELGDKRVFNIEPGDLLFSNVFAWEGAVAVASEEERGFIGSHRFMTYVPNSEADANYLHYFFLSESGLRLLGLASPGSAGRNRTLAIERFEALQIPLPPIDDQRRIAAYLDTIFTKIEKAGTLANRAAAITEGLKWAATRTHFSAPDVDLEDAVFINPETIHPARDLDTETFQYIDIGSVANGTGVVTDPKIAYTADAPSRARKLVAAGDVLVATVRPNLKGVALVPESLDGAVCSTGFAVLRPGPRLLSEYLFLQCLSDVVTEQLVEATRGGHYPAVPDHELRKVKLTVPPMEQQRGVIERAGGVLKKVAEFQARIAKRNSLLQAVPNSVLNDCFERGTDRQSSAATIT